MPKKKPSVVSLYSGAGGLDYGFEAAGFETRVAIEFAHEACETLRANRSFPVIENDIHKVSSEEILDIAGLEPGDAKVLIGGPPCQPFSKSGYWARGDSARLDDPRSDTLYAYMRCVRDLLPEVFLLENVAGINYKGKSDGLLLLQDLTSAINKEKGTHYTLSWEVLDASQYGVPQKRTRFFLVAHREGKRFSFPPPTHCNPEDLKNSQPSLGPEFSLSPFVTAWDAIGTLKTPRDGLEVQGRWADLLPSIPEGENYLWHTDRKGGLPLFGWRRRYWSFLLKLSKRLPSWTIQAQPGPAVGPFHWENRRLSVEEMARLQTFPHNLTYIGSRIAVQKQLGNAVPSLLAEVVGREIARQLLGRRPKKEPKLATPLLRPFPDAEPVQKVAERYLELIGKHSEHPGTGKGSRSIANAAT